MPTVSKGRCYLCGKELGKTAMKNHILRAHGVEEGGQECQLLKIEGADKYYCAVCGKDAAYICSECMWESDNPFFCEACAEDHEHAEMLLPVTNSPRMGVCVYDGELDTFTCPFPE